MACLLFAAFSVFFSSNESSPSSSQGLSAPQGWLTCAEVVPLLGDYKAKLVTPELSQRIAAHLAECDMCRRKFEQLASRHSVGNVWVASSIERQRAPLLVAQQHFAATY